MCLTTMAIAGSILATGCSEPVNPDVKVGFNTLKGVVECSEELASWSGVKATTISSNGNTSFRSNREVVDGKPQTDYLHEKGQDKVYCDDNVEYYVEDNKKFMNEDFDYSLVMDNLLEECMPNVIGFFANNSNSRNLVSSEIIEENDEVIYLFKLWINKSENRVLEAKFTFDNQDNLKSIDISIKVGEVEDFKSEIVPNEEIVNTPDWYNSNDYKTALTYEEVKAIVLDDNLFEGWKNAYVSVPEVMGNEKDIYMTQSSTNESYRYYSNIKKYSGDSDGKVYYTAGKEYVYVGDTAYTIKEYDISSRSLQGDIKELSSTMFQFFFYDENENGAYYVNAKKYERDREVISFKFEHPYESQIVIGSLFYNLDKELYYIDVYFAMGLGDNRQEIHFCFEKLDEEIDIPSWFDEDDFGQTIPNGQIESIFSHSGISNWNGSYIYNASVNMSGSSVLSDGVHFTQNAIVYNDNGNVSYISNSYVSQEAQSNVLTEGSENTFPKKGTYTFWFNKRYENESVYCSNGTKYSYDGENITTSSSTNYSFDFYDSIIKRMLAEFCNGTFIANLEIPGKDLINANVKNNSNLPLPGERIKYVYATKQSINNMQVYTLRYVGEASQKAFLDYTIYLDQEGNLQKISFTSNFLLPVQGVATFSLEKNTSSIVAPDWMD